MQWGWTSAWLLLSKWWHQLWHRYLLRYVQNPCKSCLYSMWCCNWNSIPEEWMVNFSILLRHTLRGLEFPAQFHVIPAYLSALFPLCYRQRSPVLQMHHLALDLIEAQFASTLEDPQFSDFLATFLSVCCLQSPCHLFLNPDLDLKSMLQNVASNFCAANFFCRSNKIFWS